MLHGFLFLSSRYCYQWLGPELLIPRALENYRRMSAAYEPVGVVRVDDGGEPEAIHVDSPIIRVPDKCPILAWAKHVQGLPDHYRPGDQCLLFPVALPFLPALKLGQAAARLADDPSIPVAWTFRQGDTMPERPLLSDHSPWFGMGQVWQVGSLRSLTRPDQLLKSLSLIKISTVESLNIDVDDERMIVKALVKSGSC
jgi:hypothetical protein